MKRHSRTMVICKPRKQASKEIQPADTMISDVQLPDPCRDTFLWLNWPVCGAVTDSGLRRCVQQVKSGPQDTATATVLTPQMRAQSGDERQMAPTGAQRPTAG